MGPKNAFFQNVNFRGPNWVGGALYGIFLIREKPKLRAGFIFRGPQLFLVLGSKNYCPLAPGGEMTTYIFLLQRKCCCQSMCNVVVVDPLSNGNQWTGGMNPGIPLVTSNIEEVWAARCYCYFSCSVVLLRTAAPHWFAPEAVFYSRWLFTWDLLSVLKQLLQKYWDLCCCVFCCLPRGKCQQIPSHCSKTHRHLAS